MFKIAPIVELEANDEGRIAEMSDNLIFYLESLAGVIVGPGQWDTGGIANILISVEGSFSEVHNDLEGNWFIVFMELGVNGKQKLLTTPDICRVSRVYWFILVNECI